MADVVIKFQDPEVMRSRKVHVRYEQDGNKWSSVFYVTSLGDEASVETALKQVLGQNKALIDWTP